MIYVHINIEYSVFKTVVLEMNFWCNVLKIKLGSSQLLIGCLYHSPTSSDAAFIEKLEDLFDSIFCIRYHCILVGDLNHSYFYVNKIKNLFLTYGISQGITEPIRITNDTTTY